MKQRTKARVATLTLCLMLPFMMIPASANSALTEWEGSKENVVMTTDGESPIVVEHETLTFDIQDLIDTYAYSSEKYDPTKEYKSSVTAEYNFYNPSDMTVTAELAFPIGSLSESAEGEYANDKYSIKVNGETIEHQIRHTYASDGIFRIEYDLPRLKDDYTTHEFVNLDTKVTKYSFNIAPIKEDQTGYPRVYFDIDPADYENTKIYCSGSYARKLDNGKIRISRNNLGMTIYFIGEVPEKLPEFVVYKDIFDSDEIEILPSRSSVSRTEEMTFRDIAFANYKEKYGISEMDWYNAVMLGMESDSPVLHDQYITLQAHDFLCWYTYELEFEPGERIVNSVTAPMIPGQNLNYNPRLFKYTYLISPAVTWADFGSMDIYINTPYYMVESNIDGFEKTENGYEIHLDGLPKTKEKLKFTWDEIKVEKSKYQDLSFSLCEEENPTRTGYGTQGVLAVVACVLGIILLPVILVVWIINLGVQFVKRQINKK